VPELPEVECIARQLRRVLIGARVTEASLHRKDVLRGSPSARGGGALLRDGVLAAVHRHGKQLALEVDDGRTLVVRLGMSGRLRLGCTHPKSAARILPPTHAHASWILAKPRQRGREGEAVFELLFIDPRRFGGLAAFDSPESARRACWSRLGPDALDLDSTTLRAAMHRSRRPIKSLLMDQGVVAGIGNIYADEILHRVGLHPLVAAAQCEGRVDALASTTRRLLAEAVRLGGSTIRDYVNASGSPGTFQQKHRVYGRVGEACLTCRRRRSTSRDDRDRGIGVVQAFILAGRTTSFCPRCQVAPVSYQQFMHRERK